MNTNLGEISPGSGKRPDVPCTEDVGDDRLVIEPPGLARPSTATQHRSAQACGSGIPLGWSRTSGRRSHAPEILCSRCSCLRRSSTPGSEPGRPHPSAARRSTLPTPGQRWHVRRRSPHRRQPQAAARFPGHGRSAGVVRLGASVPMAWPRLAEIAGEDSSHDHAACRVIMRTRRKGGLMEGSDIGWGCGVGGDGDDSVHHGCGQCLWRGGAG